MIFGLTGGLNERGLMVTKGLLNPRRIPEQVSRKDFVDQTAIKTDDIECTGALLELAEEVGAVVEIEQLTAILASMEELSSIKTGDETKVYTTRAIQHDVGTNDEVVDAANVSPNEELTVGVTTDKDDAAANLQEVVDSVGTKGVEKNKTGA